MKHKTKVYILRSFHIIAALFLYFSIGVLIYSGFTGKNLKILPMSFACLSIEALAVMINKWDCPLHPIHKKLGDEKAFFGLFLPEEHTKKAMIVSIFLGGFAIIFWTTVKFIL